MSFLRQVRPATRIVPLVVMALLAGCGQQTPEELWQEAETAIEDGDYQAATIHLKNIAQQDAGDFNAIVLLADIALIGPASRNVGRCRRRGIY